VAYSSALRRRALTGVAISALLCAASAGVVTPALAQDVESVVVTGSKIARKDADAVGPLTTVTAADLANNPSSSIGDILQKLPSAGVSYNSNGTQGTSFGASSISLRYLANTDGDADRTLVLVDGHRWVDGTGARGIRDFVDLNTIPIGIVGSMEVLKDGASAIYGADAIAGVVNIHTVQNQDGFTVNAKVGTSTYADGSEYSGFLNWGGNVEGFNLFLSASYTHSDPVLTTNRPISAQSIAAGPSNLSAAPASPRGLYILPGFSTSAAPLTQNVTGGGFHVASLPGDYYDTQAQGLYAIGPSQRYGFYARATKELPWGMTLTVDGLVNRRISSQLLSPTTLNVGGTGGTFKGFSIAANQPYNPFGVGFAANQAWSIQLVVPQVGNRFNDENVSNWHLSATLDGTLDVLGRNLKWTLFGSHAENNLRFIPGNNVDLEHLQLGLNPTLCNGQPGCVPINIFGQMDANQGAYLRANGRETNATKLSDMTFDVTGDILDLPYGALSLATGLEYRVVMGVDHPDTYINTISTGTGALPLPATTATTSGVVRTPTSTGSYNVKEGYIEFNVPLLKGLPMASSLDLDAAVRYSEYSTRASRLTSKVGIGWRPVEDLLLRATFSQGFRAPSLLELYTGSRQTTLAGTNTDPCSGGAAAHPTLPGCAGVPSTYTQTQNLPETLSGNPNVKPETAETFSEGFSYSPSFVPGLSLTSDWYTVTIYNAISTPAAATALQLCATQAGAYCNVVIRDPLSGQVTNFLSSYENLSKVKTSGLDTILRYTFDTDMGNWDAMLSTTYLDKFTTVTPNPTGAAPIVTQAAGTSTGGTVPATARATYPRWKMQGSLRWSENDWGIMWRSRFIGETKDGAAPALPATPIKNNLVRATMYHDLQFDYTFEKHDMNIAFGINNIFNTAPPQSYANVPINFDIYTYDVMGRYFTIRLSKSF
jgi:outer membrane receptor protein involved in Fe transport